MQERVAQLLLSPAPGSGLQRERGTCSSINSSSNSNTSSIGRAGGRGIGRAACGPAGKEDGGSKEGTGQRGGAAAAAVVWRASVQRDEQSGVQARAHAGSVAMSIQMDAADAAKASHKLQTKPEEAREGEDEVMSEEGGEEAEGEGRADGEHRQQQLQFPRRPPAVGPMASSGGGYPLSAGQPEEEAGRGRERTAGVCCRLGVGMQGLMVTDEDEGKDEATCMLVEGEEGEEEEGWASPGRRMVVQGRVEGGERVCGQGRAGGRVIAGEERGDGEEGERMLLDRLQETERQLHEKTARVTELEKNLEVRFDCDGT